jgi:hypothetical protein
VNIELAGKEPAAGDVQRILGNDLPAGECRTGPIPVSGPAPRSGDSLIPRAGQRGPHQRFGADQAAGSSLGFLNPELYKASTEKPAAFNDIVPPASPDSAAVIRVDYVNTVDSSGGCAVSLRAINYAGPETYCDGTGNCATRAELGHGPKECRPGRLRCRGSASAAPYRVLRLFRSALVRPFITSS